MGPIGLWRGTLETATLLGKVLAKEQRVEMLFAMTVYIKLEALGPFHSSYPRLRLSPT